MKASPSPKDMTGMATGEHGSESNVRFNVKSVYVC